MTKEGVIEVLSQLEESFGNNGHYLPNEWTHAPHIATIATQDEKAIWPDENMQIRFNTESDTLDTRRVSYKRQVNEPFYQDGEWIYFTKTGNLRTVIKEGYWEYTSRDGERPGTGDLYHEFEFLFSNSKIKLNKNTLRAMYINGEPVEEINTDTTLWLFSETEHGEREYLIYTKSGDIYTGILNWTGNTNDVDSSNTIQIREGQWNYTGNSGVRPGTTDTYYSIEFLVNGTQFDLSINNIEEMYINGDSVEEINTDKTLWFADTRPAGNYEYLIKDKNGNFYGGTLVWDGDPDNVSSLTVKNNIGKWKYTSRDAERPGTRDLYHEFRFKSGNKTINLDSSNIEKMLVNGTPVEEINTDRTLWFFSENTFKDYKYEIHNKDGLVYMGTLRWAGDLDNVEADSEIESLVLKENNGYWNIGNIETDVSTDEVFMLDKSSNYQSIRFQEIVSIALVTDRVKRAAYRYGNTL